MQRVSLDTTTASKALPDLSVSARLARAYASGPQFACRRIALYSAIVGCSFLATALLFEIVPASRFSVENARYVLTAMSQVKAAVVAIVVTVSLVALQLTASSYSPVLAASRTRNPDMWLLLTLYATAIVLDLLLLRALSFPSYTHEHLSAGPMTLALRREGPDPLFPAYCLLIACLVALYPYFRSTVNLLNPERATKSLLRDVWLWRRDIPGRRSAKRSTDAIRHIRDIALASIAQMRSETAEHAIRGLGEAVVSIVRTHATYRPNECEELVREFSRTVCTLGSRLALLEESYALSQIVQYASDTLCVVAGTRLELGRGLLDALGRVGADAAMTRLWEPVSKTLGGIARSIRDREVRKLCTPSGLTKYGIAVLSALERTCYPALESWGARPLPLLARAAVSVLDDVRLSRPAFQELASQCVCLLVKLALAFIAASTRGETEADAEALRVTALAQVARIALGGRSIAARMTQTGQPSAFMSAVSGLWEIAIVATRDGFRRTSESALEYLAQLDAAHSNAIQDQLERATERMRRSGMTNLQDIEDCRMRLRRVKRLKTRWEQPRSLI